MSLAGRVSALATRVAQSVRDHEDRLGSLESVERTIAADELVSKQTVVDDGTATGNWPNRIEKWFQGTGGASVLVQWANEYLEWRGMPAKPNTVGWRLFEKATPGATRNADVPVWEVVSDRQARDPRVQIFPGGKVAVHGDLTITPPGGPTMRTGYLVLGAEDPAPEGLPPGVLVVRVP